MVLIDNIIQTINKENEYKIIDFEKVRETDNLVCLKINLEKLNFMINIKKESDENFVENQISKVIERNLREFDAVDKKLGFEKRLKLLRVESGDIIETRKLTKEEDDLIEATRDKRKKRK